MNPDSAFRTGEGVWTHVSKALPAQGVPVLVHINGNMLVLKRDGVYWVSDERGDEINVSPDYWVTLPYKPGAAPTDD